MNKRPLEVQERNCKATTANHPDLTGSSVPPWFCSSLGFKHFEYYVTFIVLCKLRSFYDKGGGLGSFAL